VNILLIPIMGIVGAALATLASYLVMAVGLHYYSQKYYKIEYEYEKIGKILALIFITGGIYYYLYYSVGLTIIYKFILFFSFIGMLFVLHVINKNEIVNYGKQLLRR
jgi:O-antigen/teichoic acid export membrane protein